MKEKKRIVEVNWILIHLQWGLTSLILFDNSSAKSKWKLWWVSFLLTMSRIILCLEVQDCNLIFYFSWTSARWQDHNPLQSQARGSCDHHPDHRLQCGKPRIQQHPLCRLGCWGRWQVSTTLETLFAWFARHRVCCRLRGQGGHHRSLGRLKNDGKFPFGIWIICGLIFIFNSIRSCKRTL